MLSWRALLLPAGLAACSLAGCVVEDGAVRSVRDAAWGGASGTTIGKVLDARKTCGRSLWRAFRDRNGLRVVEYVCEREGVHAYLQGRLQLDAERLRRDADADLLRLDARLRGGWRELLVLQRQRQEMQHRHALEMARDGDARRVQLQDMLALELMRDCRGFEPGALNLQEAMPSIAQAARACAAGDEADAQAYARERSLALQRLREGLPHYGEAQRGRDAAAQELERTIDQQEAALRRLQEELPEQGARIRQALRQRQTTAREQLRDVRRLREVLRWSVTGMGPVHRDSVMEMECQGRTLAQPVSLQLVIEDVLQQDAGLERGSAMAAVVEQLWERCVQRTVQAAQP